MSIQCIIYIYIYIYNIYIYILYILCKCLCSKLYIFIYNILCRHWYICTSWNICHEKFPLMQKWTWFLRLFFKFAAVIKSQINTTKKMKSVILSFCLGLSESIFKACWSCYFGINIGLLTKQKRVFYKFHIWK